MSDEYIVGLCAQIIYLAKRQSDQYRSSVRIKLTTTTTSNREPEDVYRTTYGHRKRVPEGLPTTQESASQRSLTASLWTNVKSQRKLFPAWGDCSGGNWKHEIILSVLRNRTVIVWELRVLWLIVTWEKYLLVLKSYKPEVILKNSSKSLVSLLYRSGSIFSSRSLSVYDFPG